MPPAAEFLSPVHEARDAALAIESALRSLRAGLPSLSSGMGERFDDVAHRFADAADRLSRPTLRIASVGTTNAGKSTFLNGTLGRTICPTSEDEMSADLLVIEHGERWSLQVAGNKPPSFVDASERRVHDYLKDRMQETVRGRRNRAAATAPPPAAVYRVTGPIYPGTPEHPLRSDASDELLVAVYDLPGLRVRDDPENLSVIKKQVNRALCVVLMDRQSMFDVEKRQQLLSELEESVRAFGNRPSLQIFLLNKVDTRNAGDASIADQIDRASKEITSRLNLAEPAEVIGFSGLLYFYGTAVGMALREGRQADAQELRERLLTDCDKGLRAYAATLRQPLGLRQLLGRTRRLLDEGDEDRGVPPGAASSLADLEHLSDALLEAAGHRRLWETIRQRLREEMPRLLIYPDANNAWREGAKLLKDSRAYIKTQQIRDHDEIVAVIRELGEFRRVVDHELGDARLNAGKTLATFLSLTRDSDATDRNARAVAATLDSIGATPSQHPSLFNAGELLNQLVTRLDVDFLQVLQRHLERHAPSREIEAAFASGPGGGHAPALADAWESMKSEGYSKAIAQAGLVSDTEQPAGSEVERLKRLQRATAELFLASRRIMTARAEHFLRTQGSTLATEVDALTRAWAARIWDAGRDAAQQKTGFVFGEGLTVGPANLSHDEVLALPEDVIRIPEPNLGGQGSKPKERWEYQDPSASCFTGDLVKKTDTVQTLSLRLPSAAAMTRQMSDGLKSEKSAFWSRFHHWTENLFKVAFDGLQQQIAQYLAVVEEGLAARKATLEAQADSRHREWGAADNQAEAIVAQLGRLASLQGIEDERARS